MELISDIQNIILLKELIFDGYRLNDDPILFDAIVSLTKTKTLKFSQCEGSYKEFFKCFACRKIKRYSESGIILKHKIYNYTIDKICGRIITNFIKEILIETNRDKFEEFIDKFIIFQQLEYLINDIIVIIGNIYFEINII